MNQRERVLPDRIATKFSEDESGCWVWHAAHDPRNYGRVWDGATVKLAHRVVYELLVGPIPDGLTIDHLCRNHACVNPDHLEPVTQRENLLRGDTIVAKYAAQTHCKRGHEFTPENLVPHPYGRTCRTCHNDRRRKS